MISVSDETGVGRSAPLHPLGGRVREGLHHLALSRGCPVGGSSFDGCGTGLERSLFPYVPLGDGMCVFLAFSDGGATEIRDLGGQEARGQGLFEKLHIQIIDRME